MDTTTKPLPALPGLDDASNWNRPEYYSTIQCADVDGDGRAELLARGYWGMKVWGLSAENEWVAWPDVGAFDDAGNWSRPEYYSTIQCADIDGDGRAELLARGWGGITVYQCDPTTRIWKHLSSGPALSDPANWNRLEYYSTIQCADIDGDGRAELIARGSAGLHTYQFSVDTGMWVELPLLGDFTDPGGWNQQQHFATIACADIDGDGRAEVLGRGWLGIVAYQYNSGARAWASLPNGPPLANQYGWGHPQYYTTIQYADVDGDGRVELLARGADGLHAYQFNPAANSWAELPLLAEFTDPGGWYQPMHYETIQCADIDGDGQAEVLGRGGFEFQIYKYNPGDRSWRRQPNGPLWNNTNGWGAPEYYTTIQSADIDGDGMAELIARDRQGIVAWQQPPQPYLGNWAITTQTGQYLSIDPRRQCGLGMNSVVGPNELIQLRPRGVDAQGRQLVQLVGPLAVALGAPGGDGTTALIDESALGYNFFSLADPRNNGAWIGYDNVGSYFFGAPYDQRAIFARAVKIAGDATQVGRLAPGEVAFYENENYGGRAWVFYANHANFLDIQDLNDRPSSIRLGPLTGVTVYLDIGFGGTREDVVMNLPSLAQSQLGDNAISSFRVWCNLPPSEAGIRATTKLSQDYRRVNGRFEPYSVFRTILQLPRDVTQVELSANDETDILVAGQSYRIDEDRAVTLTPNSTGRIMIVSEARGIHTPGLKIRTNTMASFQRCVIYPDRDVQQHLGSLGANALYNATSQNGQPLVNRANVSSEQAGAVQQTIQRTVAAIRYDTGKRKVSAALFHDSPWELNFTARNAGSGGVAHLQAATEIRAGESLPQTPIVVNPSNAVMQSISTGDVAQLLKLADLQGGVLAQGLFDDIGNFFKKATRVVVSAVSSVAHTLGNIAQNAFNKIKDAFVIVGEWFEETGRKVVAWVVDTAEKVATFVKGLIDKIGVALERFVQWLQFVFNWDDILATQRYLHSAIDQGLDYMQRQVTQAKAPVARSFDRQRDAVRQQLNALIDQLGGSGGSPQREADVPEALEWLLSQLGDNAPGAS
ncbi:MAG TPA: FG-GAP-like repeat-containing protein, partial [Roseiflexaceae bacterium]|nr:FG-GAP-like repeat-containing protein [Roseiflexaceae bacterium]